MEKRVFVFFAIFLLLIMPVCFAIITGSTADEGEEDEADDSEITLKEDTGTKITGEVTSEESESKSFFARIIEWIKSLFS